MNNTHGKTLGSSRLELVFRWLVGIAFIYASSHKIIYPAKFADVVYGYFLFPVWSINLIAVIVPFLELFGGLALILGIYPRSAALFLTLLLAAFIGILAFNLSRGLKFDCGCFSFGGGADQTAVMGLIARDAVLLLMGGYVAGYRKKRIICLRQTGSLFGIVSP